MTSVRCEITEGFGELETFRGEWNDLFLWRRNEPSLSFEWTSAMVRHHVKPNDRGFLIRLYRASTLVGLVPMLARDTPLLGQRVTILAPLTEDNNTHSDLLLREVDEQILAALLNAILNLDVAWDCFRMARTLEQNLLVSALQRSLQAQRVRFTVRAGLPAYFLPLPRSFDEYLKARSAKFRNHLKRTERKLEAAGRVSVCELSGPDDFDAAYRALLEVERTSWKESHGTSISAVGRQTTFYRDLASAALDAGRLHLQWLCLDERPIAYNLGYVVDCSYHYLKTSYASEFRPLSPATFLRARLIAALIGHGFEEFDFPGEPYEWESQWTDEIRWRTVITAYRPSVRGFALYGLERFKHRSARAREVKHVDPRRSGGSHATNN